MARLSRIVIPGYPHHVTQRGNRRQNTFFGDADYRQYIRLMAEWCEKLGVQIWAYCLMPNHVHLIAVPDDESGLAKAIGEAHRRYTRYINFREGWRGYLWQGRFASYAMDQHYLIATARYVELNPVRAGIAKYPKDYSWSSARAHLSNQDDELVKAAPLLNIIQNWERFLASGMPAEDEDGIKRHSKTGRPLGDDLFLETIEKLSGREVRPRKPGPKPKK
ncbi:MAG: transposase [Desulfobacterales bacterium]|nr:transposase [Desulfobacterales bacterium]